MKPLPQQLAEIRERLDAATPGPWKLKKKEQHEFSRYIEADSLPRKGLATVSARVEDFGKQASVDAEFIAHAPTDIANLIKALERCREQRDRAIRDVYKFGHKSIEQPKRDARIKKSEDELEKILKGEGK